MKKFFALVAAVALTVSLQAQTLADDANVDAYAGFVEPTEFDRIDFIEDNVCYQVISDTEAKVVSPLSLKDGDFSGVDYWFPSGGYYGPVKIPETVTHEGKTYTITELGDYAFYKGDGYANGNGYPIQFPSTLKRIGKFALYHSPLQDIVIPASVEYIGDEAITDASRIILATTNHPRITIGENAFWEGASICVSEKVYEEVCKDPEWNNYKITKYYVIDGLTYEYYEPGYECVYKVVELIASDALGPHGMYNGDIAVPEFIWIDDERYEVNSGVINNCDELTSLSFYSSYFDIANCPNLSSISFKGRNIFLTINDCPKLTAIEIPASIPLVKIYNSSTEHLAIDFKHKTERCEITQLPSRSEVYLHTMMPPSGECEVYNCEIHIPVGTLNVYEHSSLGGKGNTFIEDQEAVPVPREVVIQRFYDDKSYSSRLGTGMFTPNYDAQFAMKAESMQAYKGNVISYIEFKTPDIPINVNSEEYSEACDVEYVFVTKEGNADEYLAKVPVTVIRGTWQKVWLPEPVVIDGDPLLVGVGRNGGIGMDFCGDGFPIESEKPVDGYYFSVCGTDQGDCPWPINTWMEFARDRKHHFPIRFGITGDNLPESAAALNVTEPMNEESYSSRAAKVHPKTVSENVRTYGNDYYFKTIFTEYGSDKESEPDDVVKTVPKKAQSADDGTTPIIVTLQNRTGETLDICRIRLTDKGEEVFNEEVPVFLGSNQVGDVQINAPLDKTTRYHNVEVEVLEVNGKPDEVEDDIAQPLTLVVETGNPLFPRRMVAEEGTGTWCGWCVRGIVGMEYMRETYPDRFVGIALHDGDAMAGAENYQDLIFNSFPGAYVNRTSLMDPGKDEFLYYINGDAGANVAGKVSISRVTYSDNQLEVTTTTQFGGDDQGSDYRLAYVITEDGVGPYVQANFYSGSGDDMGGFENKDNYVPVIYNDVARGIYPGITGQPNSVPANITAMEEYQYQYEFKLPGNIDKPRNTSLVVLLYDMFTGQIINADKMALADVLPEVIEETVIHTVKYSVPEQIYNLLGIRVNAASLTKKGIYIVNGRKVVR